MATPHDAVTPSTHVASASSPGQRRWFDVGVLWVAAVAAQALILFMLAQFALQQIQAYDADIVASLLREGRFKDAASVATTSGPTYFVFPTDQLIEFALVGLAVVALAWVGRRAVAWALPFALAVLSIAPAFWGFGNAAPHPIGESDDWGLWSSLVIAPANRPDGAATWPLFLGVAVQTGLLLVPLVAAPARASSLSLATTLRQAAVPSAAFALVALLVLPYPTATSLLGVPLAAFILGLLAAVVATGVGRLWVRIPAAVLVPAFIAPVMAPIEYTNPRQDALIAIIAAAGCLLVVLATLAVPMLKDRLKSVGHAPDAALPLAP